MTHIYIDGGGGGGGSGSGDAEDITFTPAGDIAATDVQAAIEEVDTEKVKRIVSVDNVIARFDGLGGDIQGYLSDVPTISDDGIVTAPGGIEDTPQGQVTPAAGTFTTLVVNTAAKILNNIWLSGKNYAGTAWVNMFKINEADEIEVGATLVLGASLEAAEDSSAVTLADMPVSATPAAGTEESFTIKIDGTNILTTGAEADSAGGIQNPKVIAHCGVNLKEITTPTAKADYGAIYTKVNNKLYFQDGAGVEHEINFV